MSNKLLKIVYCKCSSRQLFLIDILQLTRFRKFWLHANSCSVSTFLPTPIFSSPLKVKVTNIGDNLLVKFACLTALVNMENPITYSATFIYDCSTLSVNL